LADLYSESLDYARAGEQARRARAAAQRAHDASLVAQIDCTLAGVADAGGKGEGTQALLDAAVATLQAGGDDDRDALLHCLDERAVHHMKLGHVAQTRADALLAIQLQGTPRPGRRAGLAGLRANLANAYAMSGEPSRAIGEYESALGDLQQLGRGHTSAAQALTNNLGSLLARAGLWQRSVDAYAQALALLPPDDEAGRLSLGHSYARVLVLVGRAPEALALAERLFAQAQRDGKPRALMATALAAASAACALQRTDLCAARLDVLSRTAARYRPSDGALTATVDFMAATLALQRHAPDEARALLLHALDQGQAITEWNPLRTRTLVLLARAEHERGDAAAAAARASEAVASAREFALDLPACGWLGEALLAQAVVQHAAGDSALARDTARQALAQLAQAGGPQTPAGHEARQLLAGP